MTGTEPTDAGYGTRTQDMAMLHRIFRVALDLAPAAIGGVAQGDTERAGVVGAYYYNVMRLLHAHHDGEDEIIWARLYERCPDQAQAVEAIADQHKEVVPLIDTASKQAQGWSGTADQADGEDLLSTLTRLQDALVPHLDQEELVVVPLCSRYIKQEEWDQLPAHGMRAFDGDKPWLIMGLVREQMPPPVLAHMDAAMPPPVKEMWANFGEGAYTGFISQFRAPLSA
jgi:Hemerythrin HHE cation binding domain